MLQPGVPGKLTQHPPPTIHRHLHLMHIEQPHLCYPDELEGQVALHDGVVLPRPCNSNDLDRQAALPSA